MIRNIQETVLSIGIALILGLGFGAFCDSLGVNKFITAIVCFLIGFNVPRMVSNFLSEKPK